MSLKLIYYGQNDGSTQPDVTLTGDPGTDQPVLTAAGYVGGKIMALQTSGTSGRGVVIVPCNTSGSGTNPSGIPYATLLNGPGEFAGAIGPSGSKKAPVVRALWQGLVDSQAYDTQVGTTFVVGAYVYCGGAAPLNSGTANVGLYTTAHFAGIAITTQGPVGIVTHIPTATEAWLGVASLL